MTAREPEPTPAVSPRQFQRSYVATTAGAEQALADLTEAMRTGRVGCGDPDEIQLALREALNNAVRHGSSLDPQKQIQVACRCDAREGVWIMVRDEGPGFDPDKVPDPTKPENLERLSGRGVFMIRQLMDRVEYRDSGRELHMWRRPRPKT